MQKKLGKKARLQFSDMEKAYQQKYGIMPDYHYTELYHKHGAETAGRTVQANMDRIWAEMKESINPTFHPAENSPFKSDNRTERKGVMA